MNHSRRSFLTTTTGLAAAALLLPHARAAQPQADSLPRKVEPKAMPAEIIHPAKPEDLFTISLAEWSLHRALQGNKMTNLDFPRIAKETFGIDAIEYVNSFFKTKAKDEAYLKDLKTRCSDFGVTNVLIMCDGEGALGDPDAAKRTQAVENHYKWVDAAAFLGCHSIRVNAQSKGSYDEQMNLAADGLRRLCEFADAKNINVIVENHGGLSSNGAWLAATIAKVAHKRAGILPDFGNYQNASDDKGVAKPYDRYTGVQENMQYAKGVSAKSHEFDADGNEVHTDYRKMMKIVLAAGYHGRVGVEYEGSKHSEDDGIKLTKALLEKVRAETFASMRHPTVPAPANDAKPKIVGS
ncbi:MAG: sugar phosphate isomerase/epimerase [Planctomycetes bacterium]|nr:sugar phosphate isomerase/epimerase [Planctomycetota bacterium]